MSTTARAVVVRAVNGPITVETLQVKEPGPGEVMVKMSACGVCHSDLSAANGTIQMALPVVLGHEGAGVITPQLTRQALSSGIAWSILTTLSTASVATSAITPQAAKTLKASPAADRKRGVAPGAASALRAGWSHSCGRPVAQ